MSKKQKRHRRTSLEIIHSIFHFLEELPSSEMISKTELARATDQSLRSVDNWIELIIYVQSQPALLVQEFLKKYKGVIVTKHKQPKTLPAEIHSQKNKRLVKAHKIFIYLASKQQPVSVSELAKNVNLNNRSMKQWLIFIQMVQSKSKLVTKSILKRYQGISLELDFSDDSVVPDHEKVMSNAL